LNFFGAAYEKISQGADVVKKTSDDIGLTGKINTASSVVKQKAEEYKVSEKAAYVS